MPRLFIGINIYESEIIAEVQKKLKKTLSISSIKWVEKENFHITLKFLGETDSNLIISLNQRLEEVSKRSENFILQSDSIGVFGPIHKPHAIYYAFKENPMLSSLQLSVEKSLNEIGFDTGNRIFRPHLTLGRCKSLFNKDALIQVLRETGKMTHNFKINEFQLIESKLKQEGPLYETVGAFKLKGNQ